MTDNTRQLCLQRVQDVIATIAPGVTYFFPDNMPHAVITTALGGRVFSKLRAGNKLDATQKPYVELIASPRETDVVEPYDDDLYFRTLRLQVWGYQSSQDAGDSFNAPVLPLLNSFMADVQIAIEASPFWTGLPPGTTDSLRTRLGTGCILNMATAWSECQSETSAGTFVLEYTFRYPFNKRFP